MERLDNPGIWRETIGGWVGKKSFQFPSQLALPYPQKSRIKQEKQNKANCDVERSYQFWMAIKWSRSTQNQK